jgi:hypothetical protein
MLAQAGQFRTRRALLGSIPVFASIVVACLPSRDVERDRHLPALWHAAVVDENGGRLIPPANAALRRRQEKAVNAGTAMPYPHYAAPGTVVLAANPRYPHSVRRVRTLLAHERADPGLSIVILVTEGSAANNPLDFESLRPQGALTVIREPRPFASKASFPFLRDYAPVVRVRATPTGPRTEALVLLRSQPVGERGFENPDDRLDLSEGLAEIYAARLGGVPSIESLDLVADGGNLVTDGRGTCFLTRGILRKNHRSREALERELKAKLGCLQSVFLTAPTHLDPLQHVDTMLAFTDAENAVLSMPTLYEGDLGAEYQNVRRLLELGYRVHRIPRKTASITYTNVLVTRKHVYVPQYEVYKVEAGAGRGASLATVTRAADDDVTHDNRTALAVFGRLYPDRQVVGVDSNETIDTLGSWHCISHELPEAL